MNGKFLALTVAGVLILTVAKAIFLVSPMQAQKTVPQHKETLTRQERGEKVMNSLSGGKGLPPHFKQLQKDFPELADFDRNLV
jgi:hypothetical protein